MLGRLLEGGHSAIAGRLAGAFRNIGRARIADDILKAMRSAGYTVREQDPFTAKLAAILPTRERSPYAGRIRLMWQEMRGAVLSDSLRRRAFLPTWRPISSRCRTTMSPTLSLAVHRRISRQSRTDRTGSQRHMESGSRRTGPRIQGRPGGARLLACVSGRAQEPWPCSCKGKPWPGRRRGAWRLVARDVFAERDRRIGQCKRPCRLSQRSPLPVFAPITPDANVELEVPPTADRSRSRARSPAPGV